MRLPLGMLRLLILLGILGSVTSRGLAPALPGSRSGIEAWIHALDLTAALLSQPYALGGTLLSMVLLYAALTNHRLGLFFRLAVVPGGAAATALILRTATLTEGEQRLAAPMLLGMGAATSMVVLAAAGSALRHPATRAPGLVLLASALAACLSVLARWIALLDEPTDALVATGGLAATGAFVCELACVVTVWLWIAPTARRLVLELGSAVVGASIAAALFAHGRGFGDGFLVVWLQRALLQPLRNPAPFVPEEIRVALEVAVVLTALLVTLWGRRDGWLAAAMALLVLGAGSPDIPLLALSSLLGSLLVTIALGGPGLAGQSLPVNAAGAPPRPAASRADVLSY